MLPRPIAFALAVAVPLPAMAQDRVDRMEAISEEMSQIMFEAMVEEAVKDGVDRDALAAAIPDTSWTPEMRDAGACVLQEYEDVVGSDEVLAMLDRMEAVVPTLRDVSIEDWENIDDLEPAGLSEEQSMEINQTCGMVELMMDMMMSSDFMSVMMGG